MNKIPVGTEVVITEISHEDSYKDYNDLCDVPMIVTQDLLRHADGWYTGAIDNKYFYEIHVKILECVMCNYCDHEFSTTETQETTCPKCNRMILV